MVHGAPACPSPKLPSLITSHIRECICSQLELDFALILITTQLLLLEIHQFLRALVCLFVDSFRKGYSMYNLGEPSLQSEHRNVPSPQRNFLMLLLYSHISPPPPRPPRNKTNFWQLLICSL